MRYLVAEKVLKDLHLYWQCELFYEGLRAVGLIGGESYWWNCELFRIGLKELGIA